MFKKESVGGWSEEKAVTPEVQAIVDKIKEQIQARINMAMEINKGVSFCEQIVNGKNYRILIHASKSVYLAVQVYCKAGDNAFPQLIEIFENSLTMSKNTEGMYGGWSAVHFPADANIQGLADKIKPKVEERNNKKYTSFEVLEWITSVSGVFNYRVRIQTNEAVPIVIEFFLRPGVGGFPELSQVFENSLIVDQKKRLLGGEAGTPRLGGWSEDRAATKDIQAIVDIVKKQVEEKTHLQLTVNKALIYAIQVVGGFNYRIWLQANETTYLAIQVQYRVNIPLKPQVTEVFENSLTMSNNSSGLGGWSQEKTNDKEITKLAIEVRPQVETRTGKRFSNFEVITYIEQIVYGTNYRARVQVDADTFITIQFFINRHLLGAQPKLTEVINNSLAGGDSPRLGLAKLTGTSKILGGWSDEKAPTKEIQKIADTVKTQIGNARKIDMNFNTVLSFCDQLVAGWNYRILIQANEADFVAYQVYCKFGEEEKPEIIEIFENSLTMGPNYPGTPGAWSEERQPTAEVQKYVEEIRAQVEQRENKKYKFFVAMEYICQVVDGMKYRVRVKNGEEFPVVIEFSIKPQLLGARPVLLNVFPNSLLIDKTRRLLGGETESRVMLGGWSKQKDATPQVQDLIEWVKPEVEAKTHTNYTTYRALFFITQIVQGMNYRVLIQVADRKFLAIQIYTSLDRTDRPELTEIFDNSLVMKNYPPRNLGGWSREEDANEFVQKMINQIKPQIEARNHVKYSYFLALQYTSQGGIHWPHYRVRIQVGETNYLLVEFSTESDGHEGMAALQLVEIFENCLNPDEWVRDIPKLGSGNIGGRKAGGWSRPYVATPEIKGLAQQVKGQVELETGKFFPMFEALQYSEQVVAGMNYRMRVQVDEKSFVIIQVFVGLGVHVEPQVTKVLEDTPSLSEALETPLGQWSEPRPATSQVQDLAEQVKSQVEHRTGKKYPTYRAVQYIEMVLLGALHYKVTLQVAESRFIVIYVIVGVGIHSTVELKQVWENYSQLKTGSMGGWTNWKDASDSIEKLIDQLKPEIEEKTHRKFETLKALSYRTQVVAGTNYEVKVRFGKQLWDLIHVRIFLGLDIHDKPEVTQVLYPNETTETELAN